MYKRAILPHSISGGSRRVLDACGAVQISGLTPFKIDGVCGNTISAIGLGKSISAYNVALTGVSKTASAQVEGEPVDYTYEMHDDAPKGAFIVPCLTNPGETIKGVYTGDLFRERLISLASNKIYFIKDLAEKDAYIRDLNITLEVDKTTKYFAISCARTQHLGTGDRQPGIYLLIDGVKKADFRLHAYEQYHQVPCLWCFELAPGTHTITSRLLEVETEGGILCRTKNHILALMKVPNFIQASPRATITFTLDKKQKVLLIGCSYLAVITSEYEFRLKLNGEIIDCTRSRWATGTGLRGHTIPIAYAIELDAGDYSFEFELAFIGPYTGAEYGTPMQAVIFEE